MGITHATVATGTDAGTGEIHKAEWNAGHVGADFVLLEQHTASSSATLDFTTFISSTYDDYMIEGVALVMATDNIDFRVQVGTGGGPTYDTGNNYQWARTGFGTGAVATTDSGTTGAGARIANGIDTSLTAFAFLSFRLNAHNLQSTSLNKILLGETYFLDNSTNAMFSRFGGIWTTAGTAVTALRFLASSGNIASGTIRIYGIAK